MTIPQPAKPAWGNTLRLRAEVLITGGRTLTGFLHLQPIAPVHSGPERPEDVLNRGDGFLPVTTEDDYTVFVAKEQVVVVAVATDLPVDDPDRVHAARSIGLRVELTDGSVFAGIVALEQPPSRSRALDFLNDGTGFFALHAPEAIRFVNRRHIRLVTPLD
ncbi:MAG TPA: hypothetical protein VGQ17_03595 [Gemmatimonadales bacterium]|jgi:hypothetical protein|nr:hypothetical protein [Gemmatimonadales bacterium]